MKRYDLKNWTAAPYHPYVPLRTNNVETDVKNDSVLPPLPVPVPGSLYDALQSAGIIEDPNYEMNSLKAQWVSDHWWVYRTTVELPADGTRRELVLEGVDLHAHIYWNNTKIGESHNMYVPFTCDVTKLVREGTNTVTVILERAPEEMGQIGYTSRTKVQKARFNYQWDWCTRLVSIGLYRPAYVLSYEGARVTDFYFKPVGTDGDAEIRVDCKGDLSDCDVSVEIGGVSAREALFDGYAQMKLRVPDVRLWYPHGAGRQELYDLKITLRRGETVLEERVERVGFRDLKLIENEDAPLGALPYTVCCNGKRVYIKGVNFTPMDHSCYNDPAKQESLLRMIKEANINLVRVWGGGVIEDENFYRLCDELGLMVWQEFIQSSSGIDNTPSTDPGFLRALHDTAQTAAKRLRNHPSLAVFGGGNELYTPENDPCDFSDINLGMLLGVVTTFAPHVPMLPSSPSGPVRGADLAHPGRSHDVHGNWKYLGVQKHYDYFNRVDSLLHSEFGVDGMAEEETLKAFLSPENLQPTDMQHNHVWRHHGAWWDTYHRDAGIFGTPATLAEQITRSRFIQAEGLRYGVEANRRRAFCNSGSIIWQFNEPYPNVSCTCLVDYLEKKKPAYYQVAKAFAPLNVSLQYEKLVYREGEEITAQVFVTYDGEETEVKWSCTAADEKLGGTVRVGNGKSVCVGTLSVTAALPHLTVSLSAEAGDTGYQNTVRFLTAGADGLCSDEGLAEYLEKLCL